MGEFDLQIKNTIIYIISNIQQKIVRHAKKKEGRHNLL